MKKWLFLFCFVSYTLCRLNKNDIFMYFFFYQIVDLHHVFKRISFCIPTAIRSNNKLHHFVFVCYLSFFYYIFFFFIILCLFCFVLQDQLWTTYCLISCVMFLCVPIIWVFIHFLCTNMSFFLVMFANCCWSNFAFFSTNFFMIVYLFWKCLLLFIRTLGIFQEFAYWNKMLPILCGMNELCIFFFSCFDYKFVSFLYSFFLIHIEYFIVCQFTL